MGKFSELNLHWWLEEDLEDLFEEYPELNNMTIEQMNEFARKLYWEALELSLSAFLKISISLVAISAFSAATRAYPV